MDGKKQIPFLLFQAVMLAGVGVVSLRVLREEGYLDRERAQRVFVNRVRVSSSYQFHPNLKASHTHNYIFSSSTILTPLQTVSQ